MHYIIFDLNLRIRQKRLVQVFIERPPFSSMCLFFIHECHFFTYERALLDCFRLPYYAHYKLAFDETLCSFVFSRCSHCMTLLHCLFSIFGHYFYAFVCAIVFEIPSIHLNGVIIGMCMYIDALYVYSLFFGIFPNIC